MHIEAVIWDLGGVLVRTEDRSRRKAWEDRLQLETGELDRLVFEGKAGRAAAMGKASAADVWRSLRDQFGLSAEEIQSIEQDFWAGDEVDQALIRWIRDHRTKFKIGLLSNAWPDLRHALEDVWGIADVFDEIIISAETGMAKPDEQIYKLALTRLAVDPARAVFIDDFKVNVEAAESLGLHTIHFRSSDETQSLLASMLGE